MLTRTKKLLASLAALSSVVALSAPAAFGEVPPLRFGMYTTAAVGVVNEFGETRPEDQTKRWNAVSTLRGSSSRPFVIRLYVNWDNVTPNSTVLSWIQSDLVSAREKGYKAEVVLRYQPRSGKPVRNYVSFVRSAVSQFAAEPHVVGVQITNEANVPGQPDASDGAFSGVRNALVQGVKAASDATIQTARQDIQVGFNVADDAPLSFFKDLRKKGFSKYGNVVDWVGVDLYPQTWSDLTPTGPAAAAASMEAELRRLRYEALPAAGIPGGARLHISESGFPTGPGRTEAQQSELMRAAVLRVSEVRGTLGVTDYRWFSLRDANSSVNSYEAQYGVLRDDYSPKLGFETLRSLIAQLSP